MPRATIASRQLKNKDTGIDLFVLSFNEVKGLMTSTVYYQVVLVSNLACFKTPSHKESDVVQYSIDKQWSEFEELRTKVAELFSGTVLPILNKKSIIVNDHVLRERRNSLDHFLKFLASVPKIAACVPVLEFLGIDSIRAKGFSQGELFESAPRHSNDNEEEGTTKTYIPKDDVFEDNTNSEANSDLFGYGDNNTAEDEDLFGVENDRAVHVAMFEQQDVARELTEENEKIFDFLPDAIITKGEGDRVGIDEYEDNSDLLTIEDDLDKLMTVDVRKKEKQIQEKEEQLHSSPSQRDKPKTPTKPSPALKPKPPTKPKVVSSSTSHEEPELPIKSTPPSRPKPAPKPHSQQTISQNNAADKISFSSDTILSKIVTESGNVDTLDQDDIMNYLRENSTTTDDVDLFS